MNASSWAFGDAVFNGQTLALYIANRPIVLDREVLELLRALLEGAGAVVSLEQLQTAAFGRRLDPEAVHAGIEALREAFGDRGHRLIRSDDLGYRLLAPAAAQEAGALTVAPVHSLSTTRYCSVLMVDIAGSVALRSRLGEQAAGERIRNLIEAIMARCNEQGGEVIKSYGDDVLALFEQAPIASAARAAVAAQREALRSGLQLYAGFHCGPIEFRTTLGHPDALGQTVNLAARLHKLTEGAPGRIYFAEEAVEQLPSDLRVLANRYGLRDLKGFGAVSIWTLDWHEATMTSATVFNQAAAVAPSSVALHLRLGEQAVRVDERQRSCVIGRGKDVTLRLGDPELRVSSQHLLFEFAAGRWFVTDISRNGTWMREGPDGFATALPNAKQVLLPPVGALSLGRSFVEDPDGRFRLDFRIDPDR